MPRSNGASKTMKKTIIICSAAFLILMMTGCTKKQQGQETGGGSGNQMAKQEQKGEENSMFENIKDAMSSGKKMKCTYTVTEGENVMKSEAFVQGDKYKAITTFNDQSTHMIFDGESNYTWTSQAKQGMKMSNECIEDLEKDVEEMAQDMEETEEYHAEDPFENAVDMKCENVSSIDFSLPSDVEFVDQCELMKNQQKQMEKAMEGLPEGFQVPSMQ